MAFDFKKAINGDPVWYEGTPAVISDYDVLNRTFKALLQDGSKYYFMHDGKRLALDGNLSTDPPHEKNLEKKLRVSIWYSNASGGHFIDFSDDKGYIISCKVFEKVALRIADALGLKIKS